MFNNMDTDRSGTITFEELKTGLSRLGSKLSELEIKQLMDAVSNRIHVTSITVGSIIQGKVIYKSHYFFQRQPTLKSSC